MEYNILGIFVKDPVSSVEKLQVLFSQFGCVIRTRLGLNRNNIIGSVIIIDLHGDTYQINLFLEELNNIKDIDYKYIKI